MLTVQITFYLTYFKERVLQMLRRRSRRIGNNAEDAALNKLFQESDSVAQMKQRMIVDEVLNNLMDAKQSMIPNENFAN